MHNRNWAPNARASYDRLPRRRTSPSSSVCWAWNPQVLWRSSGARTGIDGHFASGESPQYSLTGLGTLGGSTSFGYGINPRGQVIGTASIRGNVHTHAFLYSGCSMLDLGTLGGSNSTGGGINASGQVTGNSDHQLSLNMRSRLNSVARWR